MGTAPQVDLMGRDASRPKATVLLHENAPEALFWAFNGSWGQTHQKTGPDKPLTAFSGLKPTAKFLLRPQRQKILRSPNRAA